MANGKHNPTFVSIGILLIVVVFPDVKAALKTTFIEDICYYKKSVTLDLRYQPTGILMSIPTTESAELFDCEVILNPAKESSVVVSIHRYDISRNDLLTIEDSDRFKIALTGYGYFKDERKAFISEGKTRIRYRRNLTEVSHPRQGFQFTFTSVKKYAPCYDNEFQCNNRFCILKEYVCDGHNHCGDGSDQKTCVPKNKETNVITNANRDVNVKQGYSSSIIWISIIGAAGGVVFLIVIVFIVVVIRSKTRKPQIPSTLNNNNPTSGGNAPLQSVSSTVQQQSPVTTADAVPSAPPAPEHERFSFYNRVRRSLRGQKNPKTEDTSKEIVTSEVYQVPPMYPSLDQRGPATAEGGIDNPEYKSEES